MTHFELSNQGKVEHKCVSKREGDWAIFSCPQCADYVRKINLVTGEMIAPKSTTSIRHNGTYMPFGLQPEIYSPN